ncbi:MAG TPA: hypothetical protein VKY31_11920 [Terriglobia bacterium]|nr:hypothetical protein [Terriglobia bacterium]
MKPWKALLLAIIFASTGHTAAQREQAIPRPAEDSQQYGRRFFVQLRTVFGRFRDSDLQRVFDGAQPIQCSELVNEPGEWRTVAFFNEKRELGDWYRSNFDEVKTDLSVFIFKGMCRGEHGPVQLTTKFPVSESVEAYNQRQIALNEVEVNVNAPVRASFDLQTKAYTFDLPYLFLVGQQNNQDIYSLDAPRVVGRDHYAPEVTDHWDCKSVVAENVTYQFLICRTTTRPRIRSDRYSNSSAPFGASAYFILSDGKEAASSVKLSFGDGNDAERTVEDLSVPAAPENVKPAAWGMPDSDERLINLVRDEFRIRFAAQGWTGRVGSAQVLSARQMTSLDAAHPANGADYCVWLPAGTSAAQPLLGDAPVVYSVSAHDSDGQTATSIVFDMLSPSGSRLGSLQCSFPRLPSASAVDFGRWSAIVGNNLVLEIRP